MLLGFSMFENWWAQQIARFKGSLQPWKKAYPKSNLRFYSALFWNTEDIALINLWKMQLKYKCFKRILGANALRGFLFGFMKVRFNMCFKLYHLGHRRKLGPDKFYSKCCDLACFSNTTQVCPCNSLWKMPVCCL